MENSCIKKKRFLFWTWEEVVHDFKSTHISKFMPTSTTFHVYSECKNCGLQQEQKFVSADELIKKGFSANFLNNISDMLKSVDENKKIL